MDASGFLDEVKRRSGGTIVDEDLSPWDFGCQYGLPHIDLLTRGAYVKLDFVIMEELHFVVYRVPPRFLLVRAWSLYFRFLSFLRLFGNVPTGDARFDSVYFTQFVPPGEIGEVVSGGVKEKLWTLSPFFEFEMTRQVFRLLKLVDINGGYRPEDAIHDINAMLDLAEHFSGPPEPFKLKKKPPASSLPLQPPGIGGS